MLLLDEKKKPCVKRFIAVHTLRRRRLSGESVNPVRRRSVVDEGQMDSLFSRTFPTTEPVTLIG